MHCRNVASAIDSDYVRMLLEHWLSVAAPGSTVNTPYIQYIYPCTTIDTSGLYSDNRAVAGHRVLLSRGCFEKHIPAVLSWAGDRIQLQSKPRGPLPIPSGNHTATLPKRLAPVIAFHMSMPRLEMIINLNTQAPYVGKLPRGRPGCSCIT